MGIKGEEGKLKLGQFCWLLLLLLYDYCFYFVKRINKTLSGMVQEYRRRFIKMTTPLENISDDLAVGKFIGGRHPKIAS